MANKKLHEIKRITFLVHPYCYAESFRDQNKDFSGWDDYYDLEVIVSKRWYKIMDAMGDDEVIVYNPGLQSEEEKALAEYGRTELGDKLLTISKRQLDCSAETMAGIAPDIDEAFRVRSNYGWYAFDIRVAAFSYNYAHDILQTLKERGLGFNPKEVTLRAMGESFDGCVINWTTMVPDYLGIPKRVEMPYELSVPDTYFLLGCEYINRIELPYDIALYLFIDGKGNPVVLYVRERVRLADPSYYASLSIDINKISVYFRDGSTGISMGFSKGQKVSNIPLPNFVRVSSSGNPEIMVASGRWRGGDRGWCSGRECHLFVSADGMKPIEFFKIAEKAVILPET